MTDQNNAAHDLGTSSGGRAYIAEYFATQLRRHDFARYINSTLAADFACVLAQHLSKLRAEGVQAGDERAAFEAHMKEKFGGLVEPWDARRGRYGFGPDNTRWEGWHDRAALASAPVAGKAVACLRRQRNGSDWGHWVPGTVQDGQRVTGLRTWQVRWLVDAAPQASEAARILFPAHLRRMWSGGEVQAWLDNHQGITPPTASAKGSLERYRNWRAEQAEADKDGVSSEGRQ